MPLDFKKTLKSDHNAITILFHFFKKNPLPSLEGHSRRLLQNSRYARCLDVF